MVYVPEDEKFNSDFTQAFALLLAFKDSCLEKSV
jgi:hypothetical protein